MGSSAETLIRTKLHPPLIRPNLVPRPQLRARVLEGLSGPLTLVTAPAGFGKTTLVAASLSGSQLPVAWLSLDQNDNQAGRFLTYLVAALQEADHAIGSETTRLLMTSQQIPPESLLASLINDLDSRDDEMVLVLDDYQFINNREVHEQMAFLLEHCPHSFHILIASRSNPPFPLARLRARGQIVEIRTADLSFNEPEAAGFLNDVMGLQLDTTTISLFKDRTEGWVVGLQMAALSIRNLKNVAGFIEGFSGTNRYILDYLVEEVLAVQPAGVQRFLLYTSILDRFTAPLCDAVLETRDTRGEASDETPENALDSRSILKYLEEANLFLVPVDDERVWFRYHHLFASLLHSRLSYLARVDENMLHIQAANWYEQNGFPEDGIHHALSAKDFPRAARLIESLAEAVWLRAEYSRLIAWVKALPADLVRTRPWLCIWYAWSINQIGILDEARLWIDAAGQALSKSNLAFAGTSIPSLDLQTLDFEIATLNAHLACLSQDYDQAIQLASKVLENPPPQNRKALLVARCHVLHGLGSMYYAVGQLDRSEEVSLATITAAREVGFDVRHIHAVNKLAHVYRTRGQLHRAYLLLQETITGFEQKGLAQFSVLHILRCRMIDLLYEWNRIEEIESMIRSFRMTGTMTELPYVSVDLYNMEARQFLLKNDFEQARKALDSAFRLIQKSYIWPALARQAEMLRVKLWLQTGELQQAIAWDQTPLDKDAERFPFLSEYRRIARVEIHLAQGRWEKALSLLAQLKTDAESGGRYSRLVNLYILEAQALQTSGRIQEASHALDSALRLAVDEDYIRTFIDEGSALSAMLLRVAGETSLPNRDYARRLLSEMQLPKSPHTATSVKDTRIDSQSISRSLLVEPLSQRELEILQLIALGNTNQAIARQLVISTGTVKAHTASIYRKLDVANRTEAVARARQLGILH